MKQLKSIVTLTDLIILAVVVWINPTFPLSPYHPFEAPHIPDKVEVRYLRPLTPDSTARLEQTINAQLNELNYYFKVHNVTDDGYNQVAYYNATLKDKLEKLSQTSGKAVKAKKVFVAAKDRPLIAVKMSQGYWRAGRYQLGPLTGKALSRDWTGRVVSVVCQADSIVYGVRLGRSSFYQGEMDNDMLASGHGFMRSRSGNYYEGNWLYDNPHGFGFHSSAYRPLRVGEWKHGRFMGERMKYTSERIYGIDISRHQHEKGRKRFDIDWSKLRITSLGARHNAGGQTFPVSFVYIKSTEGTTIRNRYFMSDYMKAKQHGIHVGAYHFFSLKSSAQAQAIYFVNHTLFRKGDFPPVLDVEPTDAQIKKIGGDDVLMQRIRTFMEIVERRTGMRPILYISQNFINNHVNNAADIKQKFNVWIARYGQYRPDVRLLYWQLCPDGKVSGITGDVDINVFNGYKKQFEEFEKTGYYK